MTFSIVARSADARVFGIAMASSSPAVAARCAHALAGAGAVASQNITDPRLGPEILAALRAGADAASALAATLARTPHGAYRQLLVIGADGPPAVHTGAHALGLAAAALGPEAAAAGNLLAHAEVPRAMIDGFAAAAGDFGARLLAGLSAGQRRGGEAGPVHSAGLRIVRDVDWPIVDLRVDWADDEDPIGALERLWLRYAPQVEDYVRRALDPAAAPSFGVPGDP
jgi:uncharacterized Ntn-hydrolase superfamily protein